MCFERRGVNCTYLLQHQPRRRELWTGSHDSGSSNRVHVVSRVSISILIFRKLPCVICVSSIKRETEWRNERLILKDILQEAFTHILASWNVNFLEQGQAQSIISWYWYILAGRYCKYLPGMTNPIQAQSQQYHSLLVRAKQLSVHSFVRSCCRSSIQ